MILPPLRSLRAGVDSQRERTGKALIQPLRDNVRLLTLLMSELDTQIESEHLDNRHDSRGRRQRGLWFFFGGGKGDDFDGLADIYVPTDGCSADRPVKSLLPQSMLTHLPSSSTHSRCVIRDAPRAQSDSRSWTLSVIFLKDPGTHAQ